MTAGTSIKRTMQILKSYPVNVLAVIVAVDRKEKGKKGTLAKKDIEDQYGYKVHSF